MLLKVTGDDKVDELRSPLLCLILTQVRGRRVE